MGALAHWFFIEPGYLQMGDTDTVSALGLGARHYGFKKTPAQSYWPGKEHPHGGLGRIWERRDRSWHRSIL